MDMFERPGDTSLSVRDRLGTSRPIPRLVGSDFVAGAEVENWSDNEKYHDYVDQIVGGSVACDV